MQLLVCNSDPSTQEYYLVEFKEGGKEFRMEWCALFFFLASYLLRSPPFPLIHEIYSKTCVWFDD
jgi:hypothetical protein